MCRSTAGFLRIDTSAEGETKHCQGQQESSQDIDPVGVSNPGPQAASQEGLFQRNDPVLHHFQEQADHIGQSPASPTSLLREIGGSGSVGSLDFTVAAGYLQTNTMGLKKAARKLSALIPWPCTRPPPI